MATPPKGHADYLALGDWNAACVVCGRKYKASEMVKLPAGVGPPWGGGAQYVCRRDWRPRQPQDFVRGIPEKMAAPWIQPWEDLFVSADYFPTEDDPNVEVNVCDFPSAQVTVSVFEGEILPVLTIKLGTGTNIGFVLNVYGGIGRIAISNSSDPCLPAAVTVTGGIGTGGDISSSIFAAEFQVQPSNTSTITPITPAVEVAIVDYLGNTIVEFVGTVIIALGENPGGATLGGTLSVTAVAGIATFDDLTLDVVADGYTLIATAAQLSATGESETFNIHVPIASQTILYTLPSPREFNLNFMRATYNGVVFINENISSSPKQIDVFNFSVQTTPVSETNIGSFAALNDGLAYVELLPPGYGILSTGTSTLKRISFDGIVESVILSYDSNLGNEIASDTSQGTNLWMGIVAGGVKKLTNLDWAGGAVTVTDVTPGGFSNCSVAYNATTIDSRIYVWNLSPSGKLGWIHTTTDTYTNLVDYAHITNKPLVAGQFGGGADTVIFIESGNDNEANILQKLDLDGTLIASCTITALSATSYGQMGIMVYDPLYDKLWFIVSSTAYIINASDMTLFGTLAVSRTGQIIPSLGNGGPYILTKSAGTVFDQLEQLILS